MTDGATGKFVLPEKLESILAGVAAYYRQAQEHLLLEVVVNSKYRVHEQWSHDNWDGGIDGHAVYLEVPEPIFHRLVDVLNDTATRLRQDMNKFANAPAEFVDEVFFEPLLQHDPNWRAKSGAALVVPSPAMVAAREEGEHLWSTEFLRVFLSHKSQHKVFAAGVKTGLAVFGGDAFVAHEDIEPTREWQAEIERALFSLDCLVALLTPDFHKSSWTDHEIGVAVGRGVPVVPVRLGCDPYGLIGKFQAVSPPAGLQPDDVALHVTTALLRQPHTSDKLLAAFTQRIRESESYAASEKLAELLPFITHLSDEQVAAMCDAFNVNGQARDCFAFNGQGRRSTGESLPDCLQRITGRRYAVDGRGRIGPSETDG